jgi:hypothetical protein
MIDANSKWCPTCESSEGGERDVFMDLRSVLTQLRKERDELDATIASLERLMPGRSGTRTFKPPSLPNGHANGTNHAVPPPAPGEE